MPWGTGAFFDLIGTIYSLTFEHTCDGTLNRNLSEDLRLDIGDCVIFPVDFVFVFLTELCFWCLNGQNPWESNINMFEWNGGPGPSWFFHRSYWDRVDCSRFHLRYFGDIYLQKRVFVYDISKGLRTSDTSTSDSSKGLWTNKSNAFQGLKSPNIWWRRSHHVMYDTYIL